MRAAILLVFLLMISVVQGQESEVLVVDIDGPITLGSFETVKGAIERAERENFSLIVLAINTNGGRVDSLFSMVDAIEGTHIPVAGFVRGRAFSAGALLLEGCDIAVMEPYSVLGSAHPVDALGKPITDNKTVNAIAEYAEAKALKHGRNGDHVRRFVTENLDLTAHEALDLGVIDFMAGDIEELLSGLGGFETSTKGVIELSQSSVETYKAPFLTQILDFLSDPNISSVLMLIGIYALIFGLVSPGLGAEIVGAMCLLLGLIGLGFEVNFVALIILALGAVLLILEFVTPEFGVLGMSGIVCMALGAIFIIPFGSWYMSPDTMTSLVMTVILLSIFLALFLAFALYKVIEVRKRKPLFSLEGDDAEAIEDLDPGGFVRYNGEYWKARSVSGRVEKGSKVLVVGKEKFVLLVERSV